MGHDELRELVRIRYELRTLAPRRDGGAAAPLLERMSALAARDAREEATLLPEMQRWRSVFRLEA